MLFFAHRDQMLLSPNRKGMTGHRSGTDFLLALPNQLPTPRPMSHGPLSYELLLFSCIPPLTVKEWTCVGGRLK
jgi:hypothetical protein